MLPEDAMVHVLSFLYQYESCVPHVKADIGGVIERHNQMYSLYTDFPWLRPILDEILREEGSFLSTLASTTSTSTSTTHPFLHRLKVIQSADVAGYQYSGGTTGREGIHNILRDGDYDWNKWYDPTLRLDLNPFYVQFTFHRTVKLLAYGIKSANDVPQRDPKDWRLLVSDRRGHELSFRPYSKFATVHAVENHSFQQRFETCWFPILNSSSSSINNNNNLPPAWTVRLAIDNTRIDGYGTQIGQLYLIVADNNSSS
eukprot:scaffold757_cov168-Amphora_coffeaeformis.AAC.5